MGIFSRLFKIGQSEAHAIVDKLQDPIKMTEQGIRDLKEDLKKSLASFAEVKAVLIRTRKEQYQAQEAADDYQRKAMQILEQAKRGDLDSQRADELATKALTKKQEMQETADARKKDCDRVEGNINTLDAKIKKLRQVIVNYENELKTLKARARVSEASKNINKSLSSIDSSSTVAMLEKMKDKVAADEALSEAYEEINTGHTSVDDELDKVLNEKKPEVSDALAKLKEQLNNK